MNDAELDVMKRLLGALMWTSGSSDFAFPEGKANVGWDSLCRPVIADAIELLKGRGEYPLIMDEETIDE